MQNETIAPEAVGHKLAQVREARGLTQAELAKELGLDRRRIWEFERGTGLNLKNLSKLAHFYGHSLDYFVNE